MLDQKAVAALEPLLGIIRSEAGSQRAIKGGGPGIRDMLKRRQSCYVQQPVGVITTRSGGR